MSALDRPTADELARGAIAAAVRNGEITPQEAQSRLRDLDNPRPRFVRSAPRMGAGAMSIMDALAPKARAVDLASLAEAARPAARTAELSPGAAPHTSEAEVPKLRGWGGTLNTLSSLPDDPYIRRCALERQRRQIRREAGAIGGAVVAVVNPSTGTPELPSASAAQSDCILPARSRPTCAGGAI